MPVAPVMMPEPVMREVLVMPDATNMLLPNNTSMLLQDNTSMLLQDNTSMLLQDTSMLLQDNNSMLLPNTTSMMMSNTTTNSTNKKMTGDHLAFVDNITKTTTKDIFRQAMETFGAVIDVKIVQTKHRKTNFGFVSFAHEQGLRNAVEAKVKPMFGGEQVIIEEKMDVSVENNVVASDFGDKRLEIEDLERIFNPFGAVRKFKFIRRGVVVTFRCKESAENCVLATHLQFEGRPITVKRDEGEVGAENNVVASGFGDERVPIDDLQNMFDMFGCVRRFNFVRRGVVVVTFRSKDSAEKALQAGQLQYRDKIITLKHDEKLKFSPTDLIAKIFDENMNKAEALKALRQLS